MACIERTVQGVERKASMDAQVNLETLDYTPIEQVPELERAFRTARLHINQTRTSLGLPPVQMSYSDVRLISGQDYSLYVDGPDCKKPSAGRFNHDTGLAFVRKSISLDNKFGLVYLASVMIHEMWHKALGNGFSERDLDLYEGLTEFLARKTMGFVKPRILGPSELSEDKARIERVLGYEKPAKTFSGEIIVSLASGACLYHSYLDKMREVESLARYCPRDFKRFLGDVFTWDSPRAERKAA